MTNEEIDKQVRVLVHSELVDSIAADAPLASVVELLSDFAPRSRLASL
jgi:hypothetical protein